MPPLSSPPIKMFCSNINSQIYLKPMGTSRSADGHFAKLTAKFRRELVDQFRHGKSFCDVSREIAGPGEVPDEQRQNLVGIHERPGAVDRANAVAIAIGAEARVVFPREHSLAQRFNVRLNRFGMHAAEA